MNAKDLRVGNLLIRNSILVTIDARSIFDVWDSDESYSGLLLTPQLLLSHSFKQATDNIWYDFQDGSYLELREVKDGWYVTIGDSPEMSCDEEQRIGITTIQYFHQLQNLIYDMKGIEI